MQRAELAVTTEGLTKRFGDLIAVDHVDLEVHAGSVVSLLGPNGAGKTTVVRMLATLTRPTSGHARVFGHDVVHDGDEVRRLISLTGQFAALEPNLNARENLVLMTRLRGYRGSAARRIVGGLIERFDITEFAGTLVKSMSGGQRRRVDLAASLVLEPRLLVLDEPTTGLDPRSRQVVWATVRDLVAQGVTVLLTTQYLEEADELADRVVVMDHGMAVATGTPSELKARIGDHRVDVMAVDDVAYRRLQEALGARFSLTSVAERRTISIPAPRQALDLQVITEVIAEAGAPVEEIALRRPTLDDTFLALTGEGPQGVSIDELREEVPA